MPSDMIFEKLIINEKCSIIRFKYHEQYLKVYQLQASAKEYGFQGNDKKQYIDNIYNPWLNKEIEICEEDFGEENKRYSVDIKMDTINYYISGVMDKTEFLKIIEGLYVNSAKK